MSEQFDGFVDSMQFFDRPLSSGELKRVFESDESFTFYGTLEEWEKEVKYRKGRSMELEEHNSVGRDFEREEP